MIRGFKKLLFLSFIFPFGLVSDTPSIAGMADKYREQNECNWNTAKYESLNGQRRYCVNRSGNIYVTNDRGSIFYKLDGSFNRTTKKYEVYGNYSTLTEWKREGNKLIKYSCITENSSTSPDCSFTMDKDVVAYTLKEAKRRREIELDKEKALDKGKASRHKGDKKYKIGDYTIAINLDAINKMDPDILLILIIIPLIICFIWAIRSSEKNYKVTKEKISFNRQRSKKGKNF